MDNRIEQDHRAIKSRVKIMKGFKNIFSALKFCTVYEEIRQLFRAKNQARSEQRGMLTSKIQSFNDLAALAA